MSSPSFRKKILTQAIVAGFSLSMMGSAFASTMYMNNNSITIGTSTATVNSSGIISTVVVTRATDSTTLPDITLPLRGLPFASTYTYRIGLQISNGSNILEVRLGVVLLTTDAVGQLNSQLSLSDSAGDPLYEKTYVYVKLGGNVTITSEFGVPADMITASGNDVTLDISKIIDELTLPGSQADALAAFTAAGNLTYKLAITDQLGGGATTDTLGHFDGVYTASTQAIAWNDATLSSNFAGASVLSGTLVIQEATTGGGGGTTGPDPDPGDGDTAVDQDQVDELDNQADNLDNTVNDELNSGTISQATVTQTQTATTTSQTQINTVTSELISNTNVSPTNVLSVLSTASKIASTGSTVVTSGSSTGTGNLGTQTTQLVTTVTQALTTLATNTSNSSTPLTRTQLETAKQTVTTLLQTASNLSGTTQPTGTTTNLATTTTKLIEAAATLGVQLDQNLVNSVSSTLQKNAAKQILGTNTEPDDATILNMLENPQQRQSLLNSTPNTARVNQPPIQTVQNQVRNNLQQNNPTLTSIQLDQLSLQLGSQNQLTQSITNQIPSNSIASSLSASLGGDASSGSGSADNTTGNLSIDLGGTPFQARPIGLQTVPTGATPSTTTLPDGNVLVVTDQGKAVTLAPTANDPVELGTAVNGLGFSIKTSDSGGIDVPVTGDVNFSGTFGFEPTPTSTGGTGTATTLTGPTGNDPASPDYLYTVNYPNGTSQTIQPSFADNNVYNSLGGLGFDLNTDRSKGIITSESSSFKPDYFIRALNDSDQAFLDANQDSSGVAYRQLDANGDGVTDYEVISSRGVQLVYGVP